MQKRKFKNRDVNWLYFNERVLLEAQNKSTPVLERLKFLAIFSSNLDEFFKVRISRLRQLRSVDKSLRKKLVLKPNKTLKAILSKVAEQQNLFGKIIADTLSEMETHQIHIRKRSALNAEQLAHLQDIFDRTMVQHCTVFKNPELANLRDGALYLAIEHNGSDYSLVTIPTHEHPRFFRIPGPGFQFVFLDDILKLNLSKLFPDSVPSAGYAIKMSRDAELYLEDELDDQELVDKIYTSLQKRVSGQPTRLLYDMEMPEALLAHIQKSLDLGDVDLFVGGAYHNLSDFFSFEVPLESAALRYGPMPPIKHPELSFTKDFFTSLQQKDQLLHLPYQSFDVLEDFIDQAAKDENVTHIKISLYRIAKASKLTDSLLLAVENGKKVVIFVEAQARFDEKNNIEWGRIFEDKGAKVFFSVPNIKVHSKIAMIERQENNTTERYAYIGTGNFNAKTARLYCDHGLFTYNREITADLAQVFLVLERKLIVPKLKHLLVSPFTSRSSFMELIQHEIDNAKAGVPAKITAKMNSLEDKKLIKALYRASEAGVEIRLLVRGFCCLVNRPKESTEPSGAPIVITSIVDRYLEHGRIYLFENGGDEKMYMGSADWMTRNLDRRVEVLTPILDKKIFSELKTILQQQLADNVKARFIDVEDRNLQVLPNVGEKEIRSQYAIYDYLKAKTV